MIITITLRINDEPIKTLQIQAPTELEAINAAQDALWAKIVSRRDRNGPPAVHATAGVALGSLSGRLHPLWIGEWNWTEELGWGWTELLG